MLAQQGSSSSQVVITNPFPQGQQLLAGANANTGAPTGGNQEGENSSNVYMMSAHDDIATKSSAYGEYESSKAKGAPGSSEPLHIERLVVEPIPRMSKGYTRHTIINHNAKEAQNYSIVEDIAQSPCAMSALEVLQSCPTQRSAFLTVIRVVDPNKYLTITFDMSNLKKILPHLIAFQIKSTYRKINIFQMVVDEGASTCVMSISCWKAIGSPQVVPSPTLLIAFDGHSHRPDGIVPAFPICVGGKVVKIQVKIFDANLDYNLPLGRNWIYEMDVIASSLFCILCFPHEGRIVTVD